MDSNIKKIIVRKGIYDDSDFVTKYKRCLYENQGKSIVEFANILRKNGLFETIFGTATNTNIMKSDLYSAYEKIVGTGTDNEFFEICYHLKDNIVIKITEHIRVYRLIEEFVKDNATNIFPLYHKDINLYISDSWWETDEEILNDFSTISFLDFFIKYKAYGWYKKMKKE